jgi:hypothetical protein
MRIRLHVASAAPLASVVLGFSFIAADGTELQGAAVHDGGLASDLEAGAQTFECRVDPMPLTPGRYYLRGAVFRRKGELYDHVDEMLAFDVLTVSADPARTPSSHYVGYVYLPYEWTRSTGEARSLAPANGRPQAPHAGAPHAGAPHGGGAAAP